ncbi:MAG: crossover junction endodeoxyribonuclease RuvC [bacterium]
MASSPKVILGVDPGSWRAGYGLIEAQGPRLQHLAHGVINAGAAGLSLPQRLGKLYDEFVRLLQRYRPEVMAVESLFHSRNARSSLVLGHARGVILLAGIHAGISVEEYTPLSVKQALTGFGAAEKTQVRYMVRSILKLKSLPPMDASDALAVAVCHAHSFDGFVRGPI